MNNKLELIFIFLLCTLLSGSIVLNLIQFNLAHTASISKARTSVAQNADHIRRIGSVTENNTDERYLIFSYQESDASTGETKVWITDATGIGRIIPKKEKGIIETISIAPIEQKDIHLGDEVYINMDSSVTNDRLEAASILLGELLPITN